MLKIYFICLVPFSLKSLDIIADKVIVSYWQQMEFYKSKSSAFKIDYLCLTHEVELEDNALLAWS